MQTRFHSMNQTVICKSVEGQISEQNFFGRLLISVWRRAKKNIFSVSAHFQPVCWHTHTHTYRPSNRKWAQIRKAFATQLTPISKTKMSFKRVGGVNSEADHYLLFFIVVCPQAGDFDMMKMMSLRNYTLITAPSIWMFCQNQCDYGDENAVRLQQKEWICEGYISLISHTAMKQPPSQKVNRKFTVL